MLLGHVPEPHTWFEEIQAVQAGCLLEVDGEGRTRERCWWDIGEVWRTAEEAFETQFDIGARLKESIKRTIQAHLVSDVPVCVFLSGGVDSGAIAAMIAEQVKEEVHWFTVTFSEFSGGAKDEEPGAEALTKQYGFRNHVL